MKKTNITEIATKDSQSITSDWVNMQQLIEGVVIKEIKNVAKETGYLTELYRDDWDLENNKVGQIFQVAMFPNSISGWHAHRITTDRLFVNIGLVKIVLYDGRIDSPTFGLINEFRFGTIRPAVVIIPPNVWHAVQNINDATSLLINYVDYEYNYENPDHYRLPLDTEHIPYKFK